MTTITWDAALQGVTPAKGSTPFPPATYRLRLVAGEGKLNSNNSPMLSLTFECESGPLKGKKAFHNENMPKDGDAPDKIQTRMAFFLGLLDAFGVTGAQVAQMFAGRPIDADSLDYLARALVSLGKVVKATATLQADNDSRNNWRNWSADDGIEPAPPKELQTAGGAPQGFPGAVPGGAPAPGPNGFAPPSGPPQGAPAGPPAGQPGSLPLGGFPGSGQPMQPNPAPEWSNQAPAAGPGQAAPAAQPAAAGMGQFTQAQAGQFPQGFGQQPPTGQPQQPPAAPNGLPTGGFPPVQQGGQPPQATF